MRRSAIMRGSIALAALAGLGVVAVRVVAQYATAPVPLGMANGRLAPCPATPNCVSSYSQDSEHAIAPLRYHGDAARARAALLAIIHSYPRVTVVQADAMYIHAVFRSRLMGYPDDVEFYFDSSGGTVQLRSAARLGRGDLGVNRSRMEQIRAQLAAAIA